MDLLLLDCGNSALKVWHTGAATHRVVPLAGLGHDPAQMLTAALGGFETPGAIALSIGRAPLADALACVLDDLFPGVPRHVLTAANVPFRIHYTEGTPGPDRLAAGMALRTIHPGRAALSVDCGTATNLCAVDAAGDFLGGSIMPGVALMAQSLARGTAGRLPEPSELTPPPPGPAGSTMGALRNGLVRGHAGAIDRLVEEARGLLGPETPVLLTGGAAGLVAPLLRCGAVMRPTLVREGLEAWARWAIAS